MVEDNIGEERKIMNVRWEEGIENRKKVGNKVGKWKRDKLEIEIGDNENVR